MFSNASYFLRIAISQLMVPPSNLSIMMACEKIGTRADACMHVVGGGGGGESGLWLARDDSGVIFLFQEIKKVLIY